MITAPENTICIQCRGRFDYEPILGLPFELRPTVCNACDEHNKASAMAGMEAVKHAEWKIMCPPLYRDTDINHPGMPPQHKLTKILNWQYGPKGLIILGKTRKAKTRCAWLLLRRLVLEGRGVVAITSGEFARSCAESHAAGAVENLAWFSSLSTPQVLFIDDLGKCKFTERVEADLFEIIESRCSLLLPTIFTTNLVGKTLTDKMTPDRGEPLVARIREFCDAVHL